MIEFTEEQLSVQAEAEHRDEHRRKSDSEELARAPYGDRKVPIWARMFGIRRGAYWEGVKGSYRACYGEITFGNRMLALGLGNYGRPHIHWAVPGLQVFFRLPHWRWLHHITRGPNDMERRSYGFSWRWGADWGGDIHLHWGDHTKIVSMPWGWNKRRSDYRVEYLGVDGQWYDRRRRPGEWQRPGELVAVGPEQWSEDYVFHYMCQPSGEAQHVNTTLNRERTFMRYRVFGMVVRHQVRDTIDIHFHEEVGNQRGSWKGGTVGCSADMKPGETPGNALRRMQRERSFDR